VRGVSRTQKLLAATIYRDVLVSREGQIKVRPGTGREAGLPPRMPGVTDAGDEAPAQV